VPAEDAAARRFFEANFTVYAMASSDGQSQGLVTGPYPPQPSRCQARPSRSSNSEDAVGPHVPAT
jgi:hypothetical protein